MKKFRTLFSIVVLGIILLSANSCKKAVDNILPDPGANCDALGEAYIEAFNTYIVDQTEANCEAYVDAFRDYLNGCGTTLSAAQLQEYNDELDDIDCSQ